MRTIMCRRVAGFQGIAYSRERGLSGQRTRTLFSVPRSALSYESRNREGRVRGRADETAVHILFHATYGSEYV
jgi:hypothetical protein